MNSTHTLLQVTVWLTFILGVVVVMVALLAGYVDLSQLRHLSLALPSVLALGVVAVAMSQTAHIANERDAARFDSLVLTLGSTGVAHWAHRANRRASLRVTPLAWALVVATGAVAVIESANMLVWNAPEVVALGVFWLDALVFIQVVVLVLALTHGRAAGTHGNGVQSGGAGGHPDGPANRYADKGSYRPRVTPGQPDSRRHPNPSGHRRPVTDPAAGANPDTRRIRRPANTPG
jgi:hypothetical protein